MGGTDLLPHVIWMAIMVILMKMERTAIEFVFDQAGNFKEYDIARVRMRGEYWGYVNQLGLLCD